MTDNSDNPFSAESAPPKRGAPIPPPKTNPVQHETSEKPAEQFDPQKMENIILRLQSEDRLPGEQEFLRNVGKVRAKYRPKILEERNASPEK